MIDSGSGRGTTRAEDAQGTPPRVIYHQAYYYTKINDVTNVAYLLLNVKCQLVKSYLMVRSHLMVKNHLKVPTPIN